MQSARAGRVVNSGFLEANEAAELAHKLKDHASVNIDGGYSSAVRRVVTVFPDNIPNASTKLAAIYAKTDLEANEFKVFLLKYLADSDIGDIVTHQDGLSAIIIDSKKKKLVEVMEQSNKIELEEIPLELIDSGSTKSRQVVVPSMRVDVIGAKALNVSRSYFSKGIKAGNVFLNGKAANKSSSAEVGDEIYAKGLGRIMVLEIQGKTRRGNQKILIEVEK